MEVFQSWLAVLAVSLVVPLAALLWVARSFRSRWGKVSSTASAGDGAFRSAEVTTSRDGDTPAAVRVAAIAAITWAVITGLVFVPLGGLLALMNFELEHAPIAGVVALCATFSGLVLAIALAMIAFRLVRRRADAQMTRWVAGFCHAHHGAVWLSFSIMVVTSSERESEVLGAAVLLAIPCGLGMLLARQVQRAQVIVDALPKEALSPPDA